MLLGGRAAAILGRRGILVSGIALIGISSSFGELAQSSGALIGARPGLGPGPPSASVATRGRLGALGTERA
jgi:hypothetical protein